MTLYLEVDMEQVLLFRSFFVVFKSQVTIKGCLIIKKGIVMHKRDHKSSFDKCNILQKRLSYTWIFRPFSHYNFKGFVNSFWMFRLYNFSIVSVINFNLSLPNRQFKRNVQQLKSHAISKKYWICTKNWFAWNYDTKLDILFLICYNS